MVGTRKSKGELLPPKVKSRSNSGPNHYKNKPKEKIVRRTDTDHWLLGKYLNYEMSRTMLPLKSDIIHSTPCLSYQANSVFSKDGKQCSATVPKAESS